MAMNPRLLSELDCRTGEVVADEQLAPKIEEAEQEQQTLAVEAPTGADVAAQAPLDAAHGDDDDEALQDYDVTEGEDMRRDSGHGTSFPLVPLYEGEDEDDDGEHPIVDMGYEYEDKEDGRGGVDFSLQQDVSSEDRASRASSGSFDATFPRCSVGSAATSKSAPARTSESDLQPGDSVQRRVSVHGRPDHSRNDIFDGQPRSRRTKALYVGGGGPSASLRQQDSSNMEFDSPGDGSSPYSRGGGGTGSFMQSHRRSTRRGQIALKKPGGGGMVEAVERLSSYQSSDFEHVAAAAAVVAASAQGSTKRSSVQFGPNDHVLVMLTLLGMADTGGDRASYTVDPVNAHGYPQGEGKTEAQRQGPYLFVLCAVTQVHFDEDERYYTVRRCDTGTEQRADPGYMEAVCDADAVPVALRAAQHTERAEQQEQDAEPIGRFVRLLDATETVVGDVARLVGPAYTQARTAVQARLRRLLSGHDGCAVHLRFSSVNFLVCCSFIFLFHTVITLAFLSHGWDRASSVLGRCVYIYIS